MRPIGSPLPAISVGTSQYNYIVNGDFSINQRRPATATSATGSATFGGYAIDRWVFVTGTGNTSTLTLTPTDLAFGHFTISPNGIGVSYPGVYVTDRVLRVSSSTSVTGTSGYIQTEIEDASTLSGKTCTLSGSIYTTSGSLGPYGIQLFQIFGTGGSPSANVTVLNTTFTNSIIQNWEFFSTTFVMPSVYGKTEGTNSDSRLALRILNQSNVTTDYYTANWQLEEAPYYTGFHKRTFQEELQLCKRYYQKSFGVNQLATSNIPGGRHFFPYLTNSTTAGGGGFGSIPLPVEMRKVPTCVIWNPSAIGGANQVINYSTNTACTSTAQENTTNPKVFNFTYTPPASTAFGHMMGAHFEAKADFND